MEEFLLKKIKTIAQDNLGGAASISKNCLQSLLSFPQLTGINEGIDFYNGLLYYCALLIKAQPFMASTTTLLNSVIEQCKRVKKEENREISLEEFKDYVTDLLKETEDKKQRMAEYGSSFIPHDAKIMTYSSSGSVTSALFEAKKNGKNFTVVLSEARPMLEGKILARTLSEKSIAVIFVTDAALPNYVKNCDMVLMGADWIAEDYFINKVGTMSVAARALRETIPFYVLALSDKILSDRYRVAEKDSHPTSEIMNEQIPGITIENPYFEEIPFEYCENVVTEEGIIPIDSIADIAEKLQINPDLSAII